MEHERARALLSDYLDGELDSAQREQLETHLQQCATCRRELEDLRRAIQALTSLPPKQAPSNFAAAVQHKVRRVRRRWNPSRRLEQKVPYEPMAILMILVLMAIVLMLVYLPTAGVEVLQPTVQPRRPPRPVPQQDAATSRPTRPGQSPEGP